MTTWAPIRCYRDLWDVPRIFLVDFQDRHFLFDCEFDDETEDFPDQYQVYLMPSLADADLAGSWVHLCARAIQHLGEVPLDQVVFDATRRKEIDAAILDQWLAPLKAG